MAYIQGNIAERNLYLTQGGSPVTGIGATDVVCTIRKEGQSSLTVKLLTISNWIEVGNGFYFIRFNEIDMDTQGVFFFTLSSSLFDNFLYDEFTIEPAPGGTPSPAPGFCTVTGNLQTIGLGFTSFNNKVTFRPVAAPFVVGQAIITTDIVYTYPDVNGNFEIDLLQGSTVIVEIERAGIRAQINIPISSSANLIDLLPPS